MLIACWSVKGGSGTTTVAAALALVLARSAPGTVLADLGGDAPAVLGLPEPTAPGLAEWLAAGNGADPAGAPGPHRLDVSGGLTLMPRGDGPLDDEPGAGQRLLRALQAEHGVVADCGGPLVGGPALALAAAATVSLLVVRPCYLALRRAVAAPIRPSGVILVGDHERSLGRADIEDVLGVPVRAEVPWDAAVARAVDAGVLGRRVPRPLERALRAAA